MSKRICPIHHQEYCCGRVPPKREEILENENAALKAKLEQRETQLSMATEALERIEWHCNSGRCSLGEHDIAREALSRLASSERRCKHDVDGTDCFVCYPSKGEEK